eukprot:RCo011344
MHSGRGGGPSGEPAESGPVVVRDQSFLITHVVKHLSSAQLKALNAEFAAAGGQLDSDGFVVALSHVLSASLATPLHEGWSPSSGHGSGPGPVAPQALLALFVQLDKDGDGRVCWNDFSSAMLETVAQRAQLKPYLEVPVVEPWRGTAVDKAVPLPEWKKLVLCSRDTAVAIFNSGTRTPFAEFRGHTASVLAACWVGD